MLEVGRVDDKGFLRPVCAFVWAGEGRGMPNILFFWAVALSDQIERLLGVFCWQLEDVYVFV